MVSIKGLDKAKVLKALYDNSHIQGAEGLSYAITETITGTKRNVTEEHCRELLEKNTDFDHLYGRVMMVDLAGDEFDESLYDQECGEGAAQRAVDSVAREQKKEEKKHRAEAAQKDGGDGEKSLEEKAESAKEAIEKIADILKELPPDECCAVVTYLKIFLLPMLDIVTKPLIDLRAGGKWPNRFWMF